jgi:hypothetical protein
VFPSFDIQKSGTRHGANRAERAAKGERSGVSLAGCRGPRHQRRPPDTEGGSESRVGAAQGAHAALPRRSDGAPCCRRWARPSRTRSSWGRWRTAGGSSDSAPTVNSRATFNFQEEGHEAKSL